MPGMLAIHDADPRKELRKKLGNQLTDMSVYGNNILVAVYRRPAKAKFGTLTLELPDATRKEDDYQGKVGLVIKLGPRAYVSDEYFDFHGQKVEVGDWVVFRPSDGWQLTLVQGDVLCRMLVESQIKMKIASPDTVW